MIDHMDKQTQPLPLEQKRGRGRPATGQALSNAERQRRYREAQKAKRNENMHKEVAEDLRAQLAEALEIIDFLNRKNTELLAQVRKQANELGRNDNELMKRVKELEDQLEQRNEKTKKTYVCAIQKKSPKGQWRTVCKYENQMEGNNAYLEVCEGEMGHLYRLINLK